MNQKLRWRLVTLAMTIFFFFSLLLVQFYKIQIVEGEKWSRQADRQHYFFVTEPFRRGKLVSNANLGRAHPDHPQVIVGDIQKYHLHIDPVNIPPNRRDEILTVLFSQLTLTFDERRVVAQQFERKSRNRKIASWLNKELRDRIQDWWLGYAKQYRIPKNALFFVADTERSYPFGKLMGQVLHTIQGRKDEVTKQAIPTGGLELYFHDLLKGELGKRKLMRSPRHSFEIGEVIKEPKNGTDIQLTINAVLQTITEEELAKGVQRFGAKSGWAAMMNPFTGEVLALAQYPFFYPPDYSKHFGDPKLIDDTRVKLVTDANEPGSIMKPVTLAMALLANQLLPEPLFDPEAKVPTSNPHFPGRKKELKDTRLHHFLNMNMALQKSSNIYMAQLYQKMVEQFGNSWCRSVLTEIFGFGKKTGIELPAETAGVIPTPGKKHPNGTLEWSKSTPYSLAMGHNLQANSLQLLRAYAIFANGGYLIRPTLVKQKKPESIYVLKREITDRVVEAMKYVTKPGGTGHRADIAGFTEVGKSGTANKIVNGGYSQDQYCSSFVGFTPLSHPEFVLVVTMDEPPNKYVTGIGRRHYGGACAAPVFREIARRSLEYLGTVPDDPFGYPRGDPRFDAEKANWVKETQSLKEMYEKWNK